MGNESTTGSSGLGGTTGETAIQFGKMISVDLNRESLNGAMARVQIRAEVEVRRQPPPEGDKLRTSLEVFDNDTDKTTIFIGDPGI